MTELPPGVLLSGLVGRDWSVRDWDGADWSVSYTSPGLPGATEADCA